MGALPQWGSSLRVFVLGGTGVIGIAAELGEWARGRALDQRLSGEKAKAELGWQPAHTDPLREIAALA